MTTTDRIRRSVVGAAAALAFAAVVAACGGSSNSTSPAASTTAARGTTSAPAAASVSVSTRTLPGLGRVLVDGRGRTLYMFEPDKRSRVTCVGACAAAWPPLRLAAGEKPVASGEARASLLGSDRDPEGGRVVTYAGWPLYTYVGDTSAGTATGQAVDANGGLWYVLDASGKVIRARPASGGYG